jgi:ferredoxin-NADP reductase
VLFVTAGSGITPVIGMLRNSLNQLGDVVLIHSAPAADDVIFGDELRQLAKNPRLRLIERHTRAQGRLTMAELADLVPDFAGRHTMTCGPSDFLDTMVSYWAAAGISENLHLERFRPVTRVSGEGGTVAFRRTGATVAADGATPLLDVGEAAGVLMPSGCRMGICRGCVVPLNEGSVRDLRTGAVTTAALGDGVAIQTCVSAAAGHCDIEL